MNAGEEWEGVDGSMKIAMISSAANNVNAGVAGTRIYLAEALRKLGVEVDLYFMEDLKWFGGGLLDRVVFPWNLASRIRKWKPYDVVDIASGDSWVLSYWKNRPAIVSSSHGLEHFLKTMNLEERRRGHVRLSWKYFIYWGGFRIWEVNQSIRRSEYAIVLNSDDKRFVEEKLGKTRVGVAPNGLPDYMLNLPVGNLDAYDDQTIRLAQIGTFIERKGIYYNTPALSHLLAKYENLEVTLLGTGCEEQKVYNAFPESVRNRVRVIPYYEHRRLPELIKGYHINLFATLSEGFGKTLIEGMACGLAPVTTDTAGPKDIVRDRHDALVIPKRDVQAIISAVELLMNDRALLTKLRKNAYETAQRYTWDNAARARLEYYRQALAAQSAGVKREVKVDIS